MRVSDVQAVAFGKLHDGVIMLLGGAKLFGELLRCQVVAELRTRRIIHVLEQLVEGIGVTQRQTNGQVQPVGGRQPAHWPQAKQGDGFWHVPGQHLALDA